MTYFLLKSNKIYENEYEEEHAHLSFYNFSNLALKKFFFFSNLQFHFYNPLYISLFILQFNLLKYYNKPIQTFLQKNTKSDPKYSKNAR